jgi:bacterioferritin-associated ferredoxin
LGIEDEMLVCHCHRVKCTTIRDTVADGARTPDEVGAACGAGTGCGGCRPMVARLVAQERGLEGTAPVPVQAPEQGA